MKLYDKLNYYAKTDAYPFHMPGHKRRIDVMPKWNPYAMDITEIDGFDNLHDAQEILKDTMDEIAAFRGAEESYLLINGTTAGLLSAISACVSHRDEILIARNCHKAVYHGIFLNELCPHYSYPQISDKLWINCGIISENIEKMLIKYPKIRLVVVTSPTYEGVVSDIESIAKIVHSHGIPLLVDQAHGAHFGMQEDFPKSALEQGADLVVESVHKTLPAFTQTALLHVQGNLVDRSRLKQFLGIYQTSSPSYVMMSGIAWCMDYCQKERKSAFSQYAKQLYQLRKQLEQLPMLVLYDGKKEAKDAAVFDYDMGKIVFGVKDNLFTGAELYSYLREVHHLEMEMASMSYVIAMTSVMDTKEGLERLFVAAKDINDKAIKRKEMGQNLKASHSMRPPDKQNKYILSPYEADQKAGRKISFLQAAGKIAKDYVYLYPPGIPLLVPGEEITEEMISYVQACEAQGLSVKGIKEETIWIVQD